MGFHKFPRFFRQSSMAHKIMYLYIHWQSKVMTIMPLYGLLIL